jgi:hypothetical protein
MVDCWAAMEVGGDGWNSEESVALVEIQQAVLRD